MLRHRTWPEPRAWLPLAILAAGAAYLLTRQHILTIDSYYYLWDVEFAPWRRLWHPHHLLLEPALRGWWRIWEWFAWPHRAVLPLQVLSTVATLAMLVLAARLLRRLLGRTLAVPLWWLVLAVSYGVWYFATQPEGVAAYALMGTAYLLWAACLPRAPGAAPPGPGTALALAATIAAAVSVHQALVLPAPLLAWMLAREAPAGSRWPLAATSLGGAGAVVLAAYLLAGTWATGDAEPAVLWRWLTGYREEFAHTCGSWRLLVSRDVIRGLGAALVTGDPLQEYVFGGRPADLQLALRLVPPVLVAGVLGLGLARLPAAWCDRDAPGRRAVLNLALVVLVAAVFAGWWEPSNRKFWAPVVPGLVALASVGWCAWWRRWPRPTTALLVATAVLMLGYNLWGGILPRHRAHDARQPLLEFLVRRTGPADAVVLREDRIWQCADYWLPGRAIHGLPGRFSDRNDPRSTVLRAAATDAVAALRRGDVLYVTASQWPRLSTLIAPALGPLPPPLPVLRFGDADIGPRQDQVLLAISRAAR